MDNRIATVKPVSESEATGKVASIYADIRAVKKSDRVSNLWRVLATNPDHLEVMWNHLKAVMHPEAVGRKSKIDPVVREAVALAVSATNGCSYCVNSHTTALKKLGLDDEALGEIMSVVALFNSTNALAEGYQIESDIIPPQ